MSWYVRRGEREIGPLGEDALRALVGTGQILHDTQVWREGLSTWAAAGALPGVLGPQAAVPLTSSGQQALVAASDATRQAAASPVTRAAPLELATPLSRFWARSLDLTVASLLGGVLIGAILPNLLLHWSAPAGEEWLILLLLLPFALTMDALIHWAMGKKPLTIPEISPVPPRVFASS